MKNFLSLLVVLSIFGSCFKNELIEKQSPIQTYPNFKDNHISLVNVKLEQTAKDRVLIKMHSEYEKDIEKIELLRGASDKSLCTFYEETIEGNSTASKEYSVIDSAAVNPSNFYMVKYTTKNKDRAFSPVYRIVMK